MEPGTELMMTANVQEFYHKPTNTFSYVVSDPESDAAVIIDPVLDYDHKSGRTGTASADTIAAYIQDKGFSVDWILETHAHADHLTAAPYLKGLVGAGIAIGEGIRTVQKNFVPVFNLKDLATDGSQFDRLFAEGDSFAIGGLTARVMSTPGHTSDSVTYVIGDAAFIGDTLFSPEYAPHASIFPAVTPDCFISRSSACSAFSRKHDCFCATITHPKVVTKHRCLRLPGNGPKTSIFMTVSTRPHSSPCAKLVTPRYPCRH